MHFQKDHGMKFPSTETQLDLHSRLHRQCHRDITVWGAVLVQQLVCCQHPKCFICWHSKFGDLAANLVEVFLSELQLLLHSLILGDHGLCTCTQRKPSGKVHMLKKQCLFEDFQLNQYDTLCVIEHKDTAVETCPQNQSISSLFKHRRLSAAALVAMECRALI